MSRFIILSGPSCIGKSPLNKAVRKFYPELFARVEEPVLYNCRNPRPGELDGVTYHFRSREYLESLRGKEGYVVLDVRNDVQALALEDLHAVFQAGKDAFFEGNPYIATALMGVPELAGIDFVTAFMSPVSWAELEYLREQAPDQVEKLITDIMRRKLLRRTQKQKGILSLPDLEDIEARCGAAYRELAYAHRFSYVLPNHDGEDSENWDAFYFPLGDARKCLLDFAAILRGEQPRFAEIWEPWPAGA